MNRFEIKSNKSGITLIELIIGMAILTLVIGMAFSLFSFSNRVYNASSSQYDVQSNIRFASQFITDELKYAADIEIISDVPSGYKTNPSSIPVYENYIYYNSTNGAILKINKYGTTSKSIGTSGSLNFTGLSSNKIVEYQITSADKDRSFTDIKQVNSLNLDLGTNTTIIGTTGTALKYKTLSDYVSGTQAPTITIGTPNNSLSLQLISTKIINSVTISEQGTTNTSRFGTAAKVDDYNMLISFGIDVSNGRKLDIDVIFAEYDGSTTLYKYTIEYSNSDNWTITTLTEGTAIGVTPVITNLPSSAQKNKTFDYTAVAIGGTGVYTFTFGDFKGWQTTPITNSIGTFSAKSAKNASDSASFDITVTDSDGGSTSYNDVTVVSY